MCFNHPNDLAVYFDGDGQARRTIAARYGPSRLQGYHRLWRPLATNRQDASVISQTAQVRPGAEESLPRLAAQLTIGPPLGFQALLHLLKQPGVTEGHCDLVRECLQRGHILLAKGAGLCTLHVEDPDEIASGPQWQGYLGPCIGQIRVIKVHGVLTHIQGDPVLSL